MSETPEPDGEDGSAVVEFLAVSILLMTLFVSILDLGLTIFVRNVMVATAAEGARYGANADRTAEDAQHRTEDLLKASLSERWARNVTAREETVEGIPTVAVSITGSLPGIGFIDAVPTFTVTGHAFREGA